MKSKTLRLQSEEIICHADTLENGERSVEARVSIAFRDEHGNTYVCDKVLPFRLKPARAAIRRATEGMK